MFSYSFALKHNPLFLVEIVKGRSGVESRVREPVNLEKLWQVKIDMTSLTKLILPAYLPLDNNLITGIRLFGAWISTRMYRDSRITATRCSNQLLWEQRSKSISGVLETMGTPKVRKHYGCGGLVRGLRSRCFSSNSNITAVTHSTLKSDSAKSVFSSTLPSGSASVRLKELMKINKDNLEYVNNGIIHIVSDPEVLILAYERIKSKPGNTTPGSDPQTLDGIDLKWFERTSKSLRAGQFKFKPARRKLIPKSSDKKKKRPLTISTPRDKIVQQAIYLVLNAIYEPSFLNSSHGSRPNKGNHTALEHIKFNFTGVKWCIEADIENNFPNISHNILLNLLRGRISCLKFLALIKNSIKAGYYIEDKLMESNLGLFQGNVTSPILNNIYLHELDIFMLNLRSSFNKGKSCKKNPLYRRISYLMEKESNSNELKKLRRERWKLNSKDPFDPNFKRIHYVRYVDDFVVGVVGSRKEAVEIQEKIRVFLADNLKLTLSSEKTILTHFSKNFILFLSARIKGTWEKEKRIATVCKGGISRKTKITSRVVLHAPIKSIFEKAVDKGFFRRRFGKFVPTNVGRLINLDHADIVSYYNNVIRGILNYYSFANNRKSLGSFIHGLKLSCARTLALKYKLRHASKVYRKFGGRLKCPNTEVELYIPPTFKAIHEFAKSRPLPDSVLFKKWNNKLTKSNLYKDCVLCGSLDDVQMHHVRKIRDLLKKAAGKKMDWLTLQMAAINRKQIPLCSFHHQAYHNKKLSLEERQLLNQRIKNFVK